MHGHQSIGLNCYINTLHFKMESISSVRDIIQENDFMGRLDRKDAYLSVQMARYYRKYLRFQWQEENYEVKTLPFALAPAPKVLPTPMPSDRLIAGKGQSDL